MELTDNMLINAPRERVFAALNDPEILLQVIPGCEALEQTADNAFEATVVQKVGPLKARFKGQVTTSDIVAPVSYSIQGEGKGGAAGRVKARSTVQLDDEDGATRLHYDVQAEITGRLAQLGGFIVQRTAKRVAAKFFDNLEALLTKAPVGSPN